MAEATSERRVANPSPIVPPPIVIPNDTNELVLNLLDLLNEPLIATNQDTMNRIRARCATLLSVDARPLSAEEQRFYVWAQTSFREIRKSNTPHHSSPGPGEFGEKKSSKGNQEGPAQSKAKDEAKLTACLVAASEKDKCDPVLPLALGKANIETTTITGSPLHLAAWDGDIERVQALADKRELLDLPNEDGFTPLFLSIFRGHTKVSQMLINAGASLHLGSQNPNGTNALQIAVFYGKLEIVKMLVENHKALIKARDFAGNSAVHYWGMGRGNTEILAVLLTAGLDVCDKNLQGYNVLHFAIRENREENVNVLVTNRTLLEARALDGTTPLIVAADCGHLRICEILLSHGAEPGAVDNTKRSAIEWAYGESAEMIKQLITTYQNGISKGSCTVQ